MTLREEAIEQNNEKDILNGLETRLAQLFYVDGEKLAYVIIFVLAILTRFFGTVFSFMGDGIWMTVFFSGSGPFWE